MRTLAALALFTASIALGASRISGDVVIVEDSTGAPHTPGILGVALPLCAFAAKGLYNFRPDDYDGLVVVSTHPMDTLSYALALTPSGYVVRQSEQGVSQGGFFVQQPPSAYGSAARLSHCVYMGPMRMLPANPDAIFMQPSGPLGGTMSSGMTAIEVLGHEYGHHWLLGVNYDKADGQGVQTLVRADTRMGTGTGTGPSTSATLHYSSLADSHSVMWGSFITPTGGDNFKLEGGDRKYGLLDQYLMGLRGASETPALLVIDDGTHLGLSTTRRRSFGPAAAAPAWTRRGRWRCWARWESCGGAARLRDRRRECSSDSTASSSAPPRCASAAGRTTRSAFT